MKPRQYFPLGKAYGQNFCNRVGETSKLINNIESGKHTFLVAPRRYGKSSLCENAFSKLNFAWAKIDFHLAVKEKDAERLISHGVTELVGKSIGSVEKLTHVIKKYVKKLKPKFTVENDLFNLELTLSEESSPAETVAEALMLLEKLLQEKNKQAVLLMDEFQEIGEMKEGKGIEGAIRAVAQETQNLAFIFCGSNSHLLQKMFEDERRPLYKLCRKLVLDRIGPEHYKPHLNKAAHHIWGESLPEPVFDKIMHLTERHPYYINYLCDELCYENEKLPTVNNVEAAWDSVIEEERSDLIKDFLSLPDNQRNLMIHIANHGGRNVFSNQNSKKMDIPVSSIPRALAGLIERGFVEKAGNEYRLIVPAYHQLLKDK